MINSSLVSSLIPLDTVVKLMDRSSLPPPREGTHSFFPVPACPYVPLLERGPVAYDVLLAVLGGNMLGKKIVRGRRHIGRQAQIMPTFGSIIVQREERMSSAFRVSITFYLIFLSTHKSYLASLLRSPTSAF